jgi:hypothetical protein
VKIGLHRAAAFSLRETIERAAERSAGANVRSWRIGAMSKLLAKISKSCARGASRKASV